jgi:hypothetical protein
MSHGHGRRLVAQAVQGSGSVTVPELAEPTDAPESTLLRDLGTPTAHGALERFRGAPRTLLLSDEQPYFVRCAHEAADAKHGAGERPRLSGGVVTVALVDATVATIDSISGVTVDPACSRRAMRGWPDSRARRSSSLSPPTSSSMA